MGILNLHHLLEPHAEPCGLRSLLGKRVAIDLSSWIVPFMCVAQRWTPYKSRRSAGTAAAPPQTPPRAAVAAASAAAATPARTPGVGGDGRHRFIKLLFFVTVRLAAAGVVPIFVLDRCGSRRDGLRKRGKKRGGGGKSSADTAFFAACEAAMRFLDAMGMAWIYARPGVEAEKVCVALELRGAVSVVVSDDADVFAYGARRVIKATELRELLQADDPLLERRVGLYRTAPIARQLGLRGSRDFACLALLCGCDFARGVDGIGVAKALSFARDVAASCTGDADDALALVLNPPGEEDVDEDIVSLAASSRKLLARCRSSESRIVSGDAGALSVHQLRRLVAAEFTTLLPAAATSLRPRLAAPRVARISEVVRAHCTMEAHRIVTLALPALALSALREGGGKGGDVGSDAAVTAVEAKADDVDHVDVHLRFHRRTPWRPSGLMPLTPQSRASGVDTELERVVTLRRDVVALWLPRDSALWRAAPLVAAAPPAAAPPAATRASRHASPSLRAEDAASPLSQPCRPRFDELEKDELKVLLARYGLKPASVKQMRATLHDLWRRVREDREACGSSFSVPPQTPSSPLRPLTQQQQQQQQPARRAKQSSKRTAPLVGTPARAERSRSSSSTATVSPISMAQCPDFASMEVIELAAVMARYGLRKRSKKQMRLALIDLWHRVREDELLR